MIYAFRLKPIALNLMCFPIYFQQFIDSGAIASFSLGSMLLGDPNANISIYNLLL